MAPWNPTQYLQFGQERTRAAEDLCARIPLVAPRRVLDLGCGPGNSTAVLRGRWPEAELIGMDSSAEMIAQARVGCPQGTWIVADLADWEPGAPGDVLFSNAALQWLPEHGRLLPRLLGLVAPAGCLAVQMPARGSTLFRSSLYSVARRSRWRDVMSGAESALTFHAPEYYYDLCTDAGARVDLWETTYYHQLADHGALVSWFETTGMRPFLERLEDEEARADFKQDVLDACRSDFPPAADGRVLLPFKRLFFLAWPATGRIPPPGR
jgi:trans-aconitate 2-methyltransferase